MKSQKNPQGQDLLANEVIGNALLRAAGLPTPAWKVIYVSESCIQHNLGLLHSSHGNSTNTSPGLQYGSAFISGDHCSEVLDALPGSSFTINNQSDCLGMYIFDVWANHCDRREVLLVRRTCDSSLDIIFIDNGHLFGGPNRILKNVPGQALCLDLRLYSRWNDAEIEAWIVHLEATLRPALDTLHNLVPKIWLNGNLCSLLVVLRQRLAKIRLLFAEELALNRRSVGKPKRQVLACSNPQGLVPSTQAMGPSSFRIRNTHYRTSLSCDDLSADRLHGTAAPFS